MSKQTDTTLINEQINFSNLMLIGLDGVRYENISAQEALKIADDANLDLVLVSPNANPPVCKLMDYGKFKFEQTKKLKEQKKNQKQINTKEIQLSLAIDTHDFETKVRNTRKFLLSGNKVNVIMRLRGRENVMIDRAIEKMQQFFDTCSDIGILAKPIDKQNNNVMMVIMPK